MKNMLLLLSFLFLFFQKINGQVEPRLIQSSEYWYDDTNELYLHASDILYEYNQNGNMINQVFKRYNGEGEIFSWKGWKSDYNQEGLLTDKTFRKYNWDLDIWINEVFYRYEYDSNGCLVKQIYQQNLVNGNESEEIIINNEDCQPVQSDYHYYRSGSLFYKIKYQYEYLNGKRQKRTRFYYDVSDTTKVNYINYTFYNEYEDVYLSTDYRIEDLDTISSTIASFEYEYTFDPSTNLLKKKYIESEYNSPGVIGLSTFYNSTEEYVYDYSCDGLLVQEDLYRGDNVSVFGLDINSNHKKTVNSYEGENPCFNSYDRISFPVDIFPNPTTSLVHLKSLLFDSGNTEIKIIDVSGRVVLEKDIAVRVSEISVDVGDLPNGTYVIQLTGGEISVSKKLVILK